jgi:Thioredoxin
MSLDFRALWAQALPFHPYVTASTEHRGLWEGIHRIAVVPEWARALDFTAAPRRLLVLAEDWCGDASNTIPILAKLAEQVPGLELRVLRRDEHPELMDRYLTAGARAIPIVIALDADFAEVGHWGPRPAELQAWVTARKGVMPKADLYPQVRKWYARDRGESTLREVLAAATAPGLTGAAPRPSARPA